MLGGIVLADSHVHIIARLDALVEIATNLNITLDGANGLLRFIVLANSHIHIVTRLDALVQVAANLDTTLISGHYGSNQSNTKHGNKECEFHCNCSK
ncbi:hypothetical protein CCP4SC76_6640002 [Gammaproteobacteria bacterium]